MPEGMSRKTDLESILDNADDYTIDVGYYSSIQKALEAEISIDDSVAQKLFTFCLQNFDHDNKVYTVNNLNIISCLLNKIKEGKCSLITDQVPLALHLLNFLKTCAHLPSIDFIKILIFDVLIQFPEETLIQLVLNYEDDIFEIINLYCQHVLPVSTRAQPTRLILKLLQILQPDVKKKFLSDGLDVWFSKVVPTVVFSLQVIQDVDENAIKCLETLADEIMVLDYVNNAHWKHILECIYTPKKYPALMKSLLEKGVEHWYKLWMVFIKLLKNQITTCINSVGTPINSMLPVVESAFKMDVTNRCRAFKCWNVLIENFSSETSETYVLKRIKLLVIPLTSNNAKVEETALAKFETWWNFIITFHRKTDKFADTVLISFLTFCFGKITPDKPTVIPGLISHKTKIMCVEAFVNLLGHYKCEGCGSLKKLGTKLINSSLMVTQWKYWMNALKAFLKICIEIGDKENVKAKCGLKSFIVIVGDLPEHNIRRDLFMEILSLLLELQQTLQSNATDLIVNVLLPIIFEDDVKIRPLLNVKTEVNHPVPKILSMLLDPANKKFYLRCDTECTLRSLRLFSDYVVRLTDKPSNLSIQAILNELPFNNSGVLLWTAFAMSLINDDNIVLLLSNMIDKFVLWPFKVISLFTNDDKHLMTWISLYECVSNKIQSENLDNEIFKMLEKHKEINSNFTVRATLAMITCKVNNDTIFDKEVEFLNKRISLWANYPSSDDLFFHVIETFSTILTRLTKTTSLTCAKVVFTTVNKLLMLFTKVIQQADEKEQLLINAYKKLLMIIDDIFKVKDYGIFNSIIYEGLTELRFCNNVIIQKASSSILDTHSISTISKAKVIHQNINETPKKSNFIENNNSFMSPSNKVSTTKGKNKDAKIVSTVLENGEEFVVVKSDWKFNPKKLTDNQKEKFKRKREDIPALYQDLSQSQDEFKLKTWKSDSMDTTSSRSETTSVSNEASNLIKDVPESDLVPELKKIMNTENISKNSKPTEPKNTENKEIIENNNKTQPGTKNCKSPRIALKDRVFRNVRNLIEKSSLSERKNELNASLTENTAKIPDLMVIEMDSTLIHSAPTKLNPFRPSRAKRIPRKFDDSVVNVVNKRRNLDTHFNESNETLNERVQHDDEVRTNDLNDSQVNDKSNTEPVITETVVSVIEEKVNSNDATSKDNIMEVSDNIATNKSICNDSNTVENNASVKTNQESNIDAQMEIENHVESHLSKPIVDGENDMTVENNDSLVDNQIFTSEKTDITNKSGTTNIDPQSTPKSIKNTKDESAQKSTIKKSNKKSRIEKELAIDTVEGNPFLNSISEKRTRKSLINTPCTRKKLSSVKTTKRKVQAEVENLEIEIIESQNTDDNIPASQDFIESSQDSTITTISKKTSKNSNKKIPMVTLQPLGSTLLNELNITTQSHEETNMEAIDNIVLPKTLDQQNDVIDLTESMDTQPIVDANIVLLKDDDTQIMPNCNVISTVDSQNTPNADTQQIDANLYCDTNNIRDNQQSKPGENNLNKCNLEHLNPVVEITDFTNVSVTTPNDTTKTITDSILCTSSQEEASSPFKDDEQRKKDFLNNTLEISPIKTLSPIRDNQTPSPETSKDYVIIKLSSPVQSNGEPIEKCNSPEIFTEDKISPDKRDVSPPRDEIVVTSISPSSSLSLRKNRPPQVRPGGRSAQILGLCVPDRTQNVATLDKVQDEDARKSSPINTSAKRNLRNLYSNTNDNEGSDENDEASTFLRLKRILPSTDSSPSGPILKRKLAEITDEASPSPASKRKRVSFHDPPVSTTVCVKKYIEPCGIRSPQNSVQKRQERLLRVQNQTHKSQRKLETVFKLDVALTKTIESFVQSEPENTEDTQMSSLEQTPVAGIVKISELNDIEPICPDLVDCVDSIEIIASELSSPAMKSLLVKEFNGKVNTVGDLAKMTELEVNRLCIKSPKIEVARKVLNDYLRNKTVETDTAMPVDINIVDEPNVDVGERRDTEIKIAEAVVEDVDIQIDIKDVQCNSVQTDHVVLLNAGVQTDESGSKTTEELISLCVKERPDFVEKLNDQLDETSKCNLAGSLSFENQIDLMLKGLNSNNFSIIMDRLLDQQASNMSGDSNKDNNLMVLQNHLCNKFDSRSLILFCSSLLKRVYDKA